MEIRRDHRMPALGQMTHEPRHHEPRRPSDEDRHDVRAYGKRSPTGILADVADVAPLDVGVSGGAMLRELEASPILRATAPFVDLARRRGVTWLESRLAVELSYAEVAGGS